MNKVQNYYNLIGCSIYKYLSFCNQEIVCFQLLLFIELTLISRLCSSLSPFVKLLPFLLEIDLKPSASHIYTKEVTSIYGKSVKESLFKGVSKRVHAQFRLWNKVELLMCLITINNAQTCQ